MRLIDYDKMDFTNEGLCQVGILLELVLAAQLVANRMSDALDTVGMKQTLFQKRKKDLNDGRKLLKQFLVKMEGAFDSDFTKIYEKGIDMGDAVQSKANDLIQLLLIYWSRGDMDAELAFRMKKALLNFKQKEDFDLDSMLKFYNVNI